MFPQNDWLKKSPYEDVLFWSDKCKEIARINPDEDSWKHPTWGDLKYYLTPFEEDYFAALNNGMANTIEKLRYIRMQLWWLGNDTIRNKEATELSSEYIQNLTELVLVFSKTLDNKFMHEIQATNSDFYYFMLIKREEEQLLMAEALRELSRFDEALELLQDDFSEHLIQPANVIRELTEQSYNLVALI